MMRTDRISIVQGAPRTAAHRPPPAAAVLLAAAAAPGCSCACMAALRRASAAAERCPALHRPAGPSKRHAMPAVQTRSARWARCVWRTTSSSS